MNDQHRCMAIKVDDETLRANLTRKVVTTNVSVYQDPDGYELIEQNFDDGSKVLMHREQYEAIMLTAAKSADLVLEAHS